MLSWRIKRTKGEKTANKERNKVKKMKHRLILKNRNEI